MRRVGKTRSPLPRRAVALAAAGLAVFLVANNCPIAGRPRPGAPALLAHRGLAQTFDIEKVKWDTNTAAVIHPPEHRYIENTLPSMRAAFDLGADIVEFDIRVTKDRRLAVFHDFRVDSRTERKGEVSAYTLAELRTMDVGYGYTHDGGATYPLRGEGVGLLPSFEEVLEAFPDRAFLVHIRDEGRLIGELLLAELEVLNERRIGRISIYGNDEAIDLVTARYPGMKSLSARRIKRAVVEYELVGWSGYVPRSARNMELHLPIEYARFLWGWPDRLVERLERTNSRLVLVKKKGPWSGGFDTLRDIDEIPKGYRGCVWTERIDRVAEYARRRASSP